MVGAILGALFWIAIPFGVVWLVARIWLKGRGRLALALCIWALGQAIYSATMVVLTYSTSILQGDALARTGVSVSIMLVAYVTGGLIAVKLFAPWFQERQRSQVFD